MIVTKNQLLDIIQLSQKKQAAHTNFMDKYFPSGAIGASDLFKYEDTPESCEYDQAEDELRNYLNQLDYEAILDIEALMDYGRELSQYDGISNLRRLIDDEYTDRTELLNSKKYFTNVRKWFAQSYPSPEGKSDAVIYLAEKSLVQYLPYAMEALDL